MTADAYTLTAAPAAAIDLEPLAQEYAAQLIGQTTQTWDRAEERMSAILAIVPPAQRRALFARVRAIITERGQEP